MLQTSELQQFTYEEVCENRKPAAEAILSHGGICVPGLLDPSDVDLVCQRIRAALLKHSWISASDDRPEMLRPTGLPHFEPEARYGVAWEGNGWEAVYSDVQALFEFHLLPYSHRVLALLGSILASEVLVHPRKISRIVYPHPDYGTPPHADRGFNPTPADVLTLWVPIYNCGPASGTILVADEDLRTRISGTSQPLDYLGQQRKPSDFEGVVWQSADLEVGDAVLFHSTATHCALPNESDEIRLSADFRFQSTEDPVHWSALLPHGFSRGLAPSWSEISRGWPTTLSTPAVKVDLSGGRSLQNFSRLSPDLSLS